MAALLMIVTIVVTAIGYRFYAARVDREVMETDPNKATPATMYQDGVEFVPAKPAVLYGYQFKSIAGYGPIVGPIVAAQWGWLPGLLWLIGGVFFIGWVQDYASSLMAMRHEGMTLGGLSYKLISPRARGIMLSFIYFYLLLVLGAFGFVVASALTAPNAPIGFLALALGGLIAGQMIYQMKQDLILSTVVALIVTLVGIWISSLPAVTSAVDSFNNLAGTLWKIDPYPAMTWKLWIWGVLALAFTYIGSVAPIWRFAQPINYTAFWLIFGGMVLSLVGMILSVFGVGPQGAALASFDDFPAFTQWSIGVGPLWPILFVTISCGAISGWHSLVSTSGTARQLEKETDALPVGAGAMFTEASLGVLSLVFAASAFGSFAGYAEVLGVSWGQIFTRGMGTYLAVLGIPQGFGSAFAAAFFVTMGLTLMQLVLRFMRVASAEMLGERYPAFKNPHVGSIVGVGLTLLILWTGYWQQIWVLFGGSNQLFAGLTLMLITIWLAREGRPHAWSLYPAVFMYVTTTAALALTAWKALQTILDGGLSFAGILGQLGAAGIGTFLVIAAVFLAYDGVTAFREARAEAAAAA